MHLRLHRDRSLTSPEALHRRASIVGVARGPSGANADLRTAPTSDLRSRIKSVPNFPSSLVGSLKKPVAAVALGAILFGSVFVGGADAQATGRTGAPMPTTTIEMPIGLGADAGRAATTVAATEQFDPHRLRDYGLYNLFWNTLGDPDLSGRGLNEVTVAGAKRLFDYALAHDIFGKESKVPDKRVTAGETALMKALLEHPHYSAFFEQDAKDEILKWFKISAESVTPRDVERPADVGSIELADRVSRSSAFQLGYTAIEDLGLAFLAEYEDRRVELESGPGTDAEKSTKVLGLFRDYASALWARGEKPGTEAAGHALLDAFEKTRYGMVQGKNNFNGAPWSAAQGMVLGVLDPNTFETSFPEARSSARVTYLDMSDAMAGPMKYVDEYRVALGLEPGAELHERRSPLGYMIGEPNGHNKVGSLREASPFTTSGLNWGIALFPGDAEIRDLPPKAGFNFKIDALDGFGYFLRMNPSYGDKLGILDEHGNELRVEKVIHRDDAQRPVAWSAKFYNVDGTEVPADKVMGVFMDASGWVKGDKKADGSVDMWWWGFCDRNTAQKLYKAKYDVPQLDRQRIKIAVGGTTITVPKADAQKLIDAHIPDLATGHTMNGFRFDDERATIMLKSGRTVVAKIKGDVFFAGPGLSRLGGDQVRIQAIPGRPIVGMVELEGIYGPTTVDVRKITTATRDDATGVVTLATPHDWQKEIIGKPVTAIDWSKGTTAGGKTVIVQDGTFPILGELVVLGADGTERIPLSEVDAIHGETKNELRISSFMTWVSANKGMYATDGSTDVVVSNGMRWTNKIDTEEVTDDSRPSWAPRAALSGISGELTRVAGDKIVWIRGLYASNEGSDPTSESFAGWIQTSRNGRILNEGFTGGAPDFGWSANGGLDWNARSTFNPYEMPDLRLALMVNGLDRAPAEMETLAKRLDFPPNWRDHVTPQD